jgi:hypothetical protein
MVALRAVVTIVMTLLTVYGFASLIFQSGDLDFLGFHGLSGTGALCWLPPILCFSVICGLALDYDVFLVRGAGAGGRGVGAVWGWGVGGGGAMGVGSAWRGVRLLRWHG